MAFGGGTKGLALITAFGFGLAGGFDSLGLGLALGISAFGFALGVSAFGFALAVAFAFAILSWVSSSSSTLLCKQRVVLFRNLVCCTPLQT